MKKQWTEGFGRFIAELSSSYSFVSRVWSSMGIGVEILSWCRTEDGKMEAETLLRSFGEKFLKTQQPDEKQQKIKKYLYCINDEEVLMLDALDGTRRLDESRDVFKGGINFHFNFPRKDRPTAEMPVKVYEMAGGVYGHIFGSFFGVFPGNMKYNEFISQHREDMSKLCMKSDDQIISFCEKFPGKLNKHGATFFLHEEERGAFIFYSVSFDIQDRLKVYKISIVEWFNNCTVGGFLVLPQLAV